MELKSNNASVLSLQLTSSNCTFMELKFDFSVLNKTNLPFKLYLYGIEIWNQKKVAEWVKVQIVPLWN